MNKSVTVLGLVCPYCEAVNTLTLLDKEPPAAKQCVHCNNIFQVVRRGANLVTMPMEVPEALLDAMEQECDCPSCTLNRKLGECKVDFTGGLPPGGNPFAPTPKPLTVPEILRSGAETYEDRQKVYGANYKHCGTMMGGLFPNGLSIAAGDKDSFNRLGLVLNCVTKLTRYCHDIETGHNDSAHDLMVFAAMLKEMTP